MACGTGPDSDSGSTSSCKCCPSKTEAAPHVELLEPVLPEQNNNDGTNLSNTPSDVDGCKSNCCSSAEPENPSGSQVKNASLGTGSGLAEARDSCCDDSTVETPKAQQGCCSSKSKELCCPQSSTTRAGSGEDDAPQPKSQCCDEDNKTCGSDKLGKAKEKNSDDEQQHFDKQDGGCCAGKDTSGVCCDTEVEAKPVVSDIQDSCCGPAREQELGSQKSEPSTTVEGDGCCDESCLDRLAQRECEKTCGETSARTTEESNAKEQKGRSSTDSDTNKSACSTHKRSIRERYGATLDILGCLCRELLALNHESCCSSAKRSTKPKRNSKQDSKAKGTSGKDVSTVGSTTSAQTCCNKTGMKKRGATTKDSCCAPQDSTIKEVLPTTRNKNSDEKGSLDTIAIDSEPGLSTSEHGALSVSGMTCSGCETKLSRTLASVQSIRNLRTSLILSRAEFDYDPRVLSIDGIMKHLERTTEFKCEVFKDRGADIEVIPSIDVAQFLQSDLALGISSMSKTDQGTVRIYFDPKIIGARTILRDSFPSELKLAPQRAHSSINSGRKHLREVGLTTILSAVLTIPVLVMAWAPLKDNPVGYGSASLALATLVQFFIAGPFYPKALKSLIFSGVIEMDLLIVLSTSAAYIFSVVSYAHFMAGKPLSTGEFFETSTLLVTLIMVGRFVSAFARQKAVESISIRSLQYPTATLADTDEEIDVRLFQYGDTFKVAPESRLPTDGTVIEGSTEIDESMVTGESQPVVKESGSTVIAGSVNGSGKITARLSRLPQENTVSTIAEMVDESKLSKPKIQELADKVASYFVPVIVAITVVVLIIWIAVGLKVRNQSGTDAAIQAIIYAITVLIVSCPCAIGLAVPMVIVIAGGVAADHGVILKAADSIELAYKTTHVIFDKTGTLTEGKMTVIQEQYHGRRDEKTKSIILGLVVNSKHPVSTAIAKHLKDQGVTESSVTDIKTVPGSGLEGRAAGLHIRAGNARWLNITTNATVKQLSQTDSTVFCVLLGTQLCATFALADTLRPDALQVVSNLLARNIAVSIVSGDSEGAVSSAAHSLGITSFKSRCSPSDKRDYIKTIMTTPNSITLFCGDGTNDAVALSQATIGVHVNEGTDVAQSAADVVLVRPALGGIPFLIDLSRAAVRRIGFNFAWSFVYNLFAVLLAAGAFVNARIPPEYAGLGELVSVLPVIAIALQLKWAKIARGGGR